MIDLLTNSVNYHHYVQSNGRMTAYDTLKRMWLKVVMTCFKLHLHGGAMDNHKILSLHR